ncbi:hypothetical protein Tco_0368200 [Tanacetum coccineum]
MAFTVSVSVSTIYIQQFWNKLTYKAKTEAYSFELDETQFVLDANLLREALEITPIDQAYQFVSPISGDAIMDFVNELGKTSGHDRPRYPVLQMLWGIITSINVDYTELMWEEFIQAIQTFLTNKANLGSPTKKGRKDKAHLVDEPDEEPVQPEPEPKPEHQGEGEEYDVKQAIQMSLESFHAVGHAHVRGVVIREPVAEATRPLLIVEGKGKAIVTEEQAAQSLLALHTPKRRSTTDQFIFQRHTPATKEASTRPSAQLQDDTSTNVVRDSPSPTDAETGAELDKTNSGGDTEILQITEELREDVDKQVNLEEKTAELDQDQAGSDPGKTYESQPPPEQVQESLKFLADEHAILEDPLSSTGTLSSMKNLEDAYTIGDQFINEKSTKDEPGKLNVEAEVVSMVTVPIYQASSSVSPLSTPNNWANALAKSYKDPEENKLLRKTSDMGSFITWFCERIRKKKLSKSDLEGPAFKVAKAFHENNISLQFQMEECHRMLTDQVDLVNLEGHRLVHDISKSLPLVGPPGQVTIQLQFFFNNDLEYLVSGDKGRKLTLSISKLKSAQYLDFGLEELVMSLWIESEREYDISDVYGISHWWFKRKEFYITSHSAPSDRIKVRSHMRILSVVSLKTLERYGYAYLKEIVLRRADYKEYKISEADFKNLHPNDFEDLYLLHLQGQLNHLSRDDKVHLFNTVNLWIRNIVIRKCVEDLQLGIEKDYTIVSKPRAVIYKDRNDQKKMMRETEVHKFSDGTLNRILDKLDHMFKDFKLYEYNSGMATRIWSEDDRRRSKDFIEVIERRLKIQRIFRSLKSFVGGRLRDVDYRLIQRTKRFHHSDTQNIRVIPTYHSEDGNPA